MKWGTYIYTEPKVQDQWWPWKYSSSFTFNIRLHNITKTQCQYEEYSFKIRQEISVRVVSLLRHDTLQVSKNVITIFNRPIMIKVK